MVGPGFLGRVQNSLCTFSWAHIFGERDHPPELIAQGAEREYKNDLHMAAKMGKSSQIEVIDLFCGVGGLTYGLRMAGLSVVAVFDIDPVCEFAYSTNNPVPFRLRDVASLEANELLREYGHSRFKVLAGCAPCQPFSSYSRPTKAGTDHRWTLVREFVRLAQETGPDVVTMENVPQLMDHGVLASAIRKLRRTGYQVTCEVVDCSKFGVPQTRRRMVLLASLHGELSLQRPNVCAVKTVRESLGTLPMLSAGATNDEDPLHRTCTLSALNLARIRASVPGGTWRDWPSRLRLACHKRETGSTFPAVYGRMEWDKPAPTMTTQYFGYGNGRFGHPSEDRALSLREGAILQTFPENYALEPEPHSLSAQRIGKLIGNAVPPELGRHIGRSIRKHLSCFL